MSWQNDTFATPPQKMSVVAKTRNLCYFLVTPKSVTVFLSTKEKCRSWGTCVTMISDVRITEYFMTGKFLRKISWNISNI